MAIAGICLAVYVIGIFVSEGIIVLIERMSKDDNKVQNYTKGDEC